jgi:hypothetical protein
MGGHYITVSARVMNLPSVIVPQLLFPRCAWCAVIQEVPTGVDETMIGEGIILLLYMR